MASTPQAKGLLMSLRVVRKLRDLGLNPEVAKDMVHRSARITHEKGNRRYHQYLFQVEGHKLVDVAEFNERPAHRESRFEETEDDGVAYKCETCKDQRKVRVFNECPKCYGVGCKRCDEGLIPSSIPCPDCTTQRTQFSRKI